MNKYLWIVVVVVFTLFSTERHQQVSPRDILQSTNYVVTVRERTKSRLRILKVLFFFKNRNNVPPVELKLREEAFPALLFRLAA